MKNKISWLLVLFGIAMPLLSFSMLIPFTKQDCSSLAMPNTVLLVHASWCSHCQQFIKIYDNTSNQEKYKNWVFYAARNDDFSDICGVKINSVPITFKNNMHDYLIGNRSQQRVENFLDN